MENTHSGNVLVIDGLTMSSLEIAGLTGKRHDNVIRDIRKMLEELGGTFPQFWGKVPSAGGRPLDIANLPKRECIILVSGYSTALRARIIDRWMTLEAALHSADVGVINSLDPSVSNQIGGIVKGIVNKQLRDLLPQMVEQAILADPRRAALDVISVRELLKDAKAIQKGRKGLNQKVGRALRDLAATEGGGVATKCPNTGVWLFKRSFAMQFMNARGAALVRSHNDAATGQRVLQFVKPRKKPDLDTSAADASPAG